MQPFFVLKEQKFDKYIRRNAMTEECYAIVLYQDGRRLHIWERLGPEEAKRIYRVYFNDWDFGVQLYRGGVRLKARDAWAEMGIYSRIRLRRLEDRVYRVKEAGV